MGPTSQMLSGRSKDSRDSWRAWKAMVCSSVGLTTGAGESSPSDQSDVGLTRRVPDERVGEDGRLKAGLAISESWSSPDSDSDADKMSDEGPV
jgi:hypothetical protein